MVETHQTEARNSFQMKILRAFTAVTESKAQFGNDLVSVNVLFGDPDNELPANNVKAMCGIFDLNIVPRRDASDSNKIKAMEVFALTLASDDEWTTEVAGHDVIKKHSPAVDILAQLVKKKLAGASAREDLDKLWNLERKRLRGLTSPPEAGNPTYYKRCMLWALFLEDSDFSELYAKKDLNVCSASIKKQMLATKLADCSEEIDGDHYTLNPVFLDFLKDPDAPRLRAVCKAVLDAVPSIKWFFEDIRNEKRRHKMAEAFLQAWSKGLPHLQTLFEESFRTGTIAGISHTRCWIGDLLPLVLGRSHNSFNALMRKHPKYPTTLGNPFNNIAIRSDRLGKVPAVLKSYSQTAWDIFQTLAASSKASPKDQSVEDIANIILKFRYSAAIKLQKLDPLFLTSQGIVQSLALSMEDLTVPSIVGDLSGNNDAGDFMTYCFRGNEKGTAVVANAVAVHDNNGDHKSKEWGARRLATLYRIDAKGVRISEYQEAVFIIDGEWKDKDVARLYRSGWNYVVRLGALETTLRKMFNIKGAPKPIKQNIAAVIREDDEAPDEG